MSYDCPACGSSNTQKVSLVYQSGTTTSRNDSLHVGAAIAGDHVIPAIATTESKGLHQTELAKRLAPPQKQTINSSYSSTGCIGIGCGTVILALVASSMTQSGGLGSFLLCLAPVLGISYWIFDSNRQRKAADEFNSTIWARAYSDWEKRFICHKCGHLFLSEDKSDPPLGNTYSSEPTHPDSSTSMGNNDSSSGKFWIAKS